MSLRTIAKPAISVCLAVGLLTLIGCESSEAQKLADLKKSLVASQQPADPKTIAEAKAKIADTPNVVIRGVIGARDFDPFEKNKSVFTITDIIDDGHEGDSNHNADDCPFCKRRAANADMALVKLVDAQGNTLSYSAADLLEVKKGDVVIVEGTAAFDETLDLFSITAKNVFKSSGSR